MAVGRPVPAGGQACAFPSTLTRATTVGSSAQVIPGQRTAWRLLLIESRKYHFTGAPRFRYSTLGAASV